MAMWLAKPVYELLPYIYMSIGIALLIAAWFTTGSPWPETLLVLGSLGLLVGLTIWLRRRDYRTTQARYNSSSLDD
jgi:hypothetical protein